MSLIVAASLPDWLDQRRLQQVAIGMVVAFVILGLLVARFVQVLVMKALLLVLLAGLAVTVWLQRDNLSHCAKTCDCSFFGQDVKLPDNAARTCEQIKTG